MKKSKARKILETTAMKEGVSVAEVRAEIAKAIDIAYESELGTAAVFWKQWKTKPTVEQVIVALTNDTQARLNFGKK